MDGQLKRDLFLVIGFVLLVTIPFLNYAFNSDDIYVLTFAEKIQEDPLDPYNFGLDRILTNEFALWYPDPMVVPYYAAAIMTLFGTSEMVLHFFFIIFPLVGALSMYALARRFTSLPLQATLLFIAVPIFTVSLHSLMQDVPGAAFSLAALALFIYGVDNNNKTLLALAGLTAGIAFLIKYNAVLIIGLMIVYALFTKSYRSLWYLLITAAVIGISFAHNSIYYGAIHIVYSVLPWLVGGKSLSTGFIDWARITFSIFTAYFSQLGGASIFTPFLVYPFLKSTRNKGILVASAVFAAMLSAALYVVSASFVSGQYTMLQLILFFLFFTAGFFFIALLLSDYLPQLWQLLAKVLKGRFSAIGNMKQTQSDTVFLLSWILVVFVFNIFIAGGSPRYLNMLTAPLIIFYIWMLQKYVTKKQVTTVLKGAVATTLVLAFALSYADYLYADSHRSFPLDTFPEASGNVYFLGHDGFKWYMEAQGATYFHTYEGEFVSGDVIVRAENPNPNFFSEEFKQKIELKNVYELDSAFPIRTQNVEAHAGWYTFTSGLIPYSISTAPVETFEVYEYIG